MKACFSLATICETPTPKALEAAAQGGFSHVELWWPKLRSESHPDDLKAIETAIQECQISIENCTGLGLELVGSEELWQESLKRALDMFQRVASLNIPLITVTTGLVHEQPCERHYALATDRLKMLRELIEPYPFQIALEFRSDSRWLTSLDTAAALVAQLGDQRIGLCVDLFHFMTGPSKLEDLNQTTVGLIKSVQCSDLIATPREIAKDSDRILPGEGDFEFRPVMDKLVNFQYSGLVSVEVPNPLLWNIPSDRVADMAYQSLFRFWPDEPADSPNNSMN